MRLLIQFLKVSESCVLDRTVATQEEDWNSIERTVATPVKAARKAGPADVRKTPGLPDNAAAPAAAKAAADSCRM